MTDGWSKGNQVYFLDGQAWGVSSKLRTFCMGKADKIADALENNKSLEDNVLDNILTMDRDNRGKPPTPIVRRHRMGRRRL